MSDVVRVMAEREADMCLQLDTHLAGIEHQQERIEKLVESLQVGTDEGELTLQLDRNDDFLQLQPAASAKLATALSFVIEQLPETPTFAERPPSVRVVVEIDDRSAGDKAAPDDLAALLSPKRSMGPGSAARRGFVGGHTELPVSPMSPSRQAGRGGRIELGPYYYLVAATSGVWIRKGFDIASPELHHLTRGTLIKVAEIDAVLTLFQRCFNAVLTRF